MPKPLVAIVGRPNVGKSTLFNRIIGERRAVVSDIPGTTRDRIIAPTEWEGREFLVTDTGGIEILPPSVEDGRRPGPDRPLLEDSDQFIPEIRAQARQAIDAADVILFLTDVITGITGADRQVADLLRRTEKPVLVVVNKVDNDKRELAAMEFYELGLAEIITISALHGLGVGDLLDRVVEMLPSAESSAPLPEDAVRIAILGRPNVGKSSLLNRLLGEERAIVSPVAGTTRDALDTKMSWGDRTLVLIDTAGIRRRGKIDPGVERYSVLRAARSLHRADVALLMVDTNEGVTSQDTHIAGMISDAGVSTVTLVNKWDIATPYMREIRSDLEEQVRYKLRFLNFIPVLFISALTGYRVEHVVPTALDVYDARYHRLDPGRLNDLILNAMAEHAPPNRRGRRLRIYRATQIDVAPPTFAFDVNDPQLMHFSYKRYLENRIRDAFSFPGTPIRFVYRQKKKG
ncbi:MAG: ribosome biogenesis GTPase Der [Anaerolineales bacterium]